MNELRHTVLCVDDEQNILNALKRLLRKETFRLLTCTNGREGLELLARNDVQVVISDQRMPEMNGTDFLREVKDIYPQTIRIILTGYTDVETISNSINKGHIYKFFLKPWNDQQLLLEIRQALEQFELVKANKRLYEMTLEQNEELRTINDNLETIVAERTSVLERQNLALQLSQSILEELPFPIVGISKEMTVALVNAQARRTFADEGDIAIGEQIALYFTGLTKTRIDAVINDSAPHQVTCSGGKSHSEYQFDLFPLTGRFSGGGCILTTTRDANPETA